MALQMFFRYFVNDLESGPELEQFVDQVVSLGLLTVLVSIPSPSLICLRVSCVYIVSVHDIHVYLPICCQLIFQHNLLWPDLCEYRVVCEGGSYEHGSHEFFQRRGRQNRLH